MKHLYLTAITLFFIAIHIEAQIVNIPDVNFKNALLNNFPVIDINGNGEIENSEAEALTYLNVEFENISNLSGIEAFTNLTSLQIRNNNITNLDISNNTSIVNLDCSNNQIITIDLGINPNLQGLNCSNNQISTLDLSSTMNLYQLNANVNSLTTLDASNNQNLLEISAETNALTYINLNGTASLNNLYLSGNQLTSLDLSTNINLTNVACNHNQLTSITFGNLTQLTHLYINHNSLQSINLNNLPSLYYLNSNNNLLTSLDISNNNFLSTLYIEDNLFTNIDNILNNTASILTLYAQDNVLESVDLTNNASVTRLYLNGNQLTNFIGNSIIETVDLSNNQFTTIDLSDNYENLDRIVLNDNSNLVYINIKNGNNADYFYIRVIDAYQNLTNLEAICLDNINSSFASWIQQQNTQTIVFTEYCSFTPGGEYYTISGNTIFDFNNNGCDINDIVYPNLNMQISNGVTDGSFYSNNSGEYTMPIQAGNYTITPELENPNYFNITPTTVTVNFPTDSSPFTQDFCITPNGTHNDLEITIIPLEAARPGFDTDYRIIYKNKGNTELSGSIDLSFSDDYMNFLNANPTANSQATGSLSWNYSNLQPFETREIDFTMTLNTPTDANFPLNGGDVLDYTVTINPLITDETPIDNTMVLNQEVVNSYDPNDKTCLEGSTITPEHVGEYIHYLIRFENTGTASAINIVVKDVIDTSKYNLSSLTPLNASHDFFTRIRNGNEVEFIFENINLPFDDDNNDGYVLFKIRTLPSLSLGDSFSNQAEIYFDFNFPIITNNETTVVQNNLSIDEFNFDTSIHLYPNPSGYSFSIKNKNSIPLTSVEVYDISGKKLKQFSVSQNYNIQELASGIYYVRIKSVEGEVTKKLMKA